MIFVGGIHGVGKTTLCKYVEKEFDLSHYSSSALISKLKRKQFTDKKIANISSNQDFLIEALGNLNLESQEYILDGHFCLLNKDEEIVNIPVETFINLSPNAILLIISPIEKIVQRLYERDNQHYLNSFIDLFQKREIEYSNEIANILEVPWFILDSNATYDEIYMVISKLVKISKERLN